MPLNDSNQTRYNAPPGVPSDVGTQYNTEYYHKKALIEAAKETYFGQLADTTVMPKHFGKTIQAYHYMPILDDRNTNDQGIDAAGVTLAQTQYLVSFPSGTVVVTNATKAAATAAINANIDNAGSARTLATAGADNSGGTGFANITLTGNLVVKYLNSTTSNAVVALNIGATATTASGNLYGSSKDIGKINGKLPLVGETGGRVNRVGSVRKNLSADITKLGFFSEYSKDSLDFDTDEELYEHISRELVMAANEITEDVLQMDLINGAGLVRYAGIATTNSEVTGEVANTSVVTYSDLQKLSIDLDNNRTPKKTKVITGSRMVDTKVVPAGRYLYCGSEMVITLSKMKDHHNNPAFIGVEHYAHSGVMGVNSINGEIGKIGDFRVIQVPEMLHWQGAGATATISTYRSTAGKYNVYPMLVIGDGSFTTIGFQTDGKSTKFQIKHSAPGDNISYSKDDPYGEIGFTSIKWWYGTLILRPERLAVLKTVAEV